MSGSCTRALAAAAVLSALSVAGTARADDALTAVEQASLARGEVVKRPVTLEREEGRCVGGIAYVVIEAPASSVMAALLDVGTYRSILPMTLDAREVARPSRDEWLVALRHGGKLGSARFTTRIRQESDELVRFWMDPTRAHEVEDVWGYFRVQPLGERRSLLTYAAVVRLGFGVVQLFFEERVRNTALDTPKLVRRFIQRRELEQARLASLAPAAAPLVVPGR